MLPTRDGPCTDRVSLTLHDHATPAVASFSLAPQTSSQCQILGSHPSHHLSRQPPHRNSTAVPSSPHPTRCVALSHAPVSLIHTRPVVGPLCRKSAHPPWPYCTRAQHGWSDSCVCSHTVWPMEHTRRAGDHQPTQTFRHRLARGLPCRPSAPRHRCLSSRVARLTSCHVGNIDRGHCIAYVYRSHDGWSYRRAGRSPTHDSMWRLYRFLDSWRLVYPRRLRHARR
jgi:hypothetical protein